VAATELDFEQPLVELRRRIEELEGFPASSERDRELKQLQRELEQETRRVFGTLNRWQKTLLARHPNRPYTLDFVGHLMEDFVELHGDRCFGDDAAIVGGLARFRGRPVVVLGHQKGRSTKERLRRNFGQPKPEGYRKALRLMQLAERFRRPILTFIDTAGAYPGVEAEERGQAEAIARNLLEMSRLRVPILVTITGEGGSGGALALGVGNRVLILEFGIYSVISPEGCAAILWKDQEQKVQAAEALRLTAADLLELGVVDEVIPEPLGGAHTDPVGAARAIGEALERHLRQLEGMSEEELVEQRYQRFRNLGAFFEKPS
jgi:acetyl-CoA carboxylase carboxyl transferase subunit alpha